MASSSSLKGHTFTSAMYANCSDHPPCALPTQFLLPGQNPKLNRDPRVGTNTLFVATYSPSKNRSTFVEHPFVLFRLFAPSSPATPSRSPVCHSKAYLKE